MENLKMKMRNAESYYLMSNWGGVGLDRSPIVKNLLIEDPLGIAVDGSSNFYVTGKDVTSVGENRQVVNCIKKFTPDGNLVAKWSENGEGKEILPYGISVARNDNIYITEPRNGCVENLMLTAILS